MAIKVNVYYLWQIYFLHQFIPLLHHLLFLRMYNSDEYLAQNLNYVGPYGQESQFRGLDRAVLVSHRIEFRMANIPGFLSSHVETMKSLTMCENSNFPHWQNCLQQQDNHQPGTDSKEQDRERRRLCIECGLRLERTRNEYVQKNLWTEYYYYYYLHQVVQICCDHFVIFLSL